MRVFSYILFISFFSITGSFAAAKSLGKHGDWHAYKKDGVCYMVSMAQKSEGKYKKRGDVYLVVTHRPSQKSKNVVSFHAGYSFKKGAQITSTIIAKAGNKTEKLFTEGEIGWFVDAKTDTSMVDYMTKKGISMIFTGTSARGTRTKDTVSLKGAFSAHRAISKSCATR